MADGFGNAASMWAARLPQQTPWIVADFDRVNVGLAHAAAIKRTGKSIAASVLVPDMRSSITCMYGSSMLNQVASYDERDELFVGLALENLSNNNIGQRDWLKLDTILVQATREFLSGCDMWVTRSTTEMQRILAVIGYAPEMILIAAPHDPLVFAPPKEPSRVRRGIVVWAPYLAREECAVLAFGLESLLVPVTILCKAGGPALGGLRAVFHAAMDGADMLAGAAVIVDASLDDPGSTIALARYGVPLLATATSGAHEWLRPLFLYQPWNARSVHDAVAAALGGCPPKPVRKSDGVADVQAALDAADDSLPTAGPLVSIVIPTYNRRERLRTALQSVADQRYTTVEAVVVNDGGDDVADVVATFPNARLIENECNRGVTPSMNAGVHASRGKYLGFLADDDFLQPDHVARLVSALERSGLDVAHSKELALYYDVEADGAQVLRGHSIGAPAPTYCSEMLVTNRLGGPSVMVRRRALDESGPFDTDMRHGSDFEMWMRLSKDHSFVFVNHVTAHVSMRNDRSQLSSVSGFETASIMRQIYTKHPVSGRAIIDSHRTLALGFTAGQSVLRSKPLKALAATDLIELELR